MMAFLRLPSLTYLLNLLLSLFLLFYQCPDRIGSSDAQHHRPDPARPSRLCAPTNASACLCALIDSRALSTCVRPSLCAGRSAVFTRLFSLSSSFALSHILLLIRVAIFESCRFPKAMSVTFKTVHGPVFHGSWRFQTLNQFFLKIRLKISLLLVFFFIIQLGRLRIFASCSLIQNLQINSTHFFPILMRDSLIIHI